MASAVGSQLGFWQRLYPPIPEKAVNAGDWDNVIVHKRGENGEFIKYHGTPIKFRYTREISTGNLYGIEEKTGLQKPHQIALKALGMCVATPLYAAGIMIANAIKIAIDVSALFWRVLPNLVRDLKVKSYGASLGNGLMAVTIEIPTNVLKDAWRIAKSPLYAVHMMAAALFTILSPLEGRKWLGEVEYEWHERVPYKMDIRHGKSISKLDALSPGQAFSEIKDGKILFLGYCMQARGNLINDKTAGKPRFEMVGETTE